MVIKIILLKDGTSSIDWGAYGVPESFLIYQNNIIRTFIGPINNDNLLEIKKISKILPISPDIIKSQLESVLNDFKIDAIKIGMLYDASIIKAVHSMIKKQKCPIVVDPIIESTTKTILLKKSAIKDYKKNRSN